MTKGKLGLPNVGEQRPARDLDWDKRAPDLTNDPANDTRKMKPRPTKEAPADD